MATPSEILTMINTDLPTNGNNEITAAVLRPVLIAMVNQINDLVGDASGLPNPYTDVISALNGITPQNIQIHTGTDDPNDTPPSSFNVGDFYSQTLSSVIIAFWQYNGILWVEVLSRQQQKLRNYVEVTESYTILENDDVILYDGTNISDEIALPDPTLNTNRVLVLVNISAFDINTDIGYTASDGSGSTALNSKTVVRLISFGGKYQQINTIDTV